MAASHKVHVIVMLAFSLSQNDEYRPIKIFSGVKDAGKSTFTVKKVLSVIGVASVTLCPSW